MFEEVEKVTGGIQPVKKSSVEYSMDELFKQIDRIGGRVSELTIKIAPVMSQLDGGSTPADSLPPSSVPLCQSLDSLSSRLASLVDFIDSTIQRVEL